MQRINKVLAAAGLGSRRDVEELILQGRVDVDGTTVTNLATRVNPQVAKIEVDGQLLRRPKMVYYALNKPKGVLSTSSDPSGRMRVIDFVPDKHRVFSVGRLDRYSEGLMLLTNDGDLAQRLAHPRFRVQKTYFVVVAGILTIEELAKLRKGVYLAEGVARIDGARIRKTRKTCTELEILLSEGKNREIRRILARAGHKVVLLRRLAIGPLRLAELPVGAARELTANEIKALYAATEVKAAPKSKPQVAQAEDGSESTTVAPPVDMAKVVTPIESEGFDDFGVGLDGDYEYDESQLVLSDDVVEFGASTEEEMDDDFVADFESLSAGSVLAYDDDDAEAVEEGRGKRNSPSGQEHPSHKPIAAIEVADRSAAKVAVASEAASERALAATVLEVAGSEVMANVALVSETKVNDVTTGEAMANDLAVVAEDDLQAETEVTVASAVSVEEDPADIAMPVIAEAAVDLRVPEVDSTAVGQITTSPRQMAIKLPANDPPKAVTTSLAMVNLAGVALVAVDLVQVVAVQVDLALADSERDDQGLEELVADVRAVVSDDVHLDPPAWGDEETTTTRKLASSTNLLVITRKVPTVSQIVPKDLVGVAQAEAATKDRDRVTEADKVQGADLPDAMGSEAGPSSLVMTAVVIGQVIRTVDVRNSSLMVAIRRQMIAASDGAHLTADPTAGKDLRLNLVNDDQAGEPLAVAAPQVAVTRSVPAVAQVAGQTIAWEASPVKSDLVAPEETETKR